MAFEKSKRFIESVEDNLSVTADQVFELITCILDDAAADAGVEGSGELKVGDGTLYARSLNRICNAITSSYSANKEGLYDVRESLKERCANHSAALTAVKGDIALTAARAEEELSVRHELEKERDILKRDRGHLLLIEGENAAIKREIERLSDAKLDTLAEENRGLKATLSLQQSKAKQLIDQHKVIMLDLEEAERELTELCRAIDDANEKKGAALKAKQLKEVELEGIENGIGKLEKEAGDLEARREALISAQGEIAVKIGELKSHLNLLIAVWNSFAENEQGGKVLSGDQSEDIGRWFDKKIADATAVLESVESRYKDFVAKSEKLTK